MLKNLYILLVFIVFRYFVKMHFIFNNNTLISLFNLYFYILYSCLKKLTEFFYNSFYIIYLYQLYFFLYITSIKSKFSIELKLFSNISYISLLLSAALHLFYNIYNIYLLSFKRLHYDAHWINVAFILIFALMLIKYQYPIILFLLLEVMHF